MTNTFRESETKQYYFNQINKVLSGDMLGPVLSAAALNELVVRFNQEAEPIIDQETYWEISDKLIAAQSMVSRLISN